MTETNISRTRLLKWFIKEELRVFSSLFGVKRLAMFPIVILSFSLVLGVSIPLFSFDVAVAGGVYHLIIILFGLQTGKIGFEARDTIENVMGGGSRILFSSRTLPISEKVLVSVFLIKDAIFYSVFMLLPIVVGGIVGLAFTPFSTAGLGFTISTTSILSLYLTTIVSFVFGVSFGFVLTTVNVKKHSNLGVIIAFVSSLVVALMIFEPKISTLSDMGIVFWVVLLGGLSILLSTIGVYQFRVASTSTEDKDYSDMYTRILDLTGLDSNAGNLMLKSVTDIRRSAGGFWKVVFSTATIVVTSYLLIAVMQKFFYTSGYIEIAVASLFGLIAYPVYTVLYRYDSLNTYSHYPVSEEEVYKSKVYLYIVITAVLGVAYYTPIAYSNTGFAYFVQGLLVIFGMFAYQLGLLTWFVKDKPMEFLFDGMLFSGYSIAVLVFMIPSVIVGLYGALLSGTMVTMIILANVAAGVVGLLLATSKVVGYWEE